MKTSPLRMCLSCRKMYAKSDIIRVVRQKSGEYVVDHSGKMQGRGAYICKNNDCIAKCVSKKLLNRSFKTAVPEEIYDTISRENIKD